ncbi:parafibromin [Trichinella spiralis]|nr:parafibromin [Trichinella spiralis]
MLNGNIVLRSYLVAPFSAMSTGVTWSTIIPLFYTLYEEASNTPTRF